MQVTQNILQNKKLPLVSFVITYHDQPIEFICECIESVLALSLSRSEREIIVVDDGSAYCPMNDLMKYGNDIKYLRKPNGGVSSARNIGMKMAAGEYLQFIDGDDKLICAPYEHCPDIIRFNDTDMVIFDFTKKQEATSKRHEPDVHINGTEYMHNNNIKGAVWCYLFKKSIIGSLTFTPGIEYGEDEEFTPQLLLRAENIYKTNATAYFYRQHSESVLNKSDIRSHLKRIDDNLKVILHLKNVSNELPGKDSIALQRRVAQLTMDYIYNTIILTRSKSFIMKKLHLLSTKGLFPLPDKNYSSKYKWFRRMTNSSIGLNILIKALPLVKKEK